MKQNKRLAIGALFYDEPDDEYMVVLKESSNPEFFIVYAKSRMFETEYLTKIDKEWLAKPYGYDDCRYLGNIYKTKLELPMAKDIIKTMTKYLMKDL